MVAVVELQKAILADVFFRGVRRSVWVGFDQTQNPNHIGFSGLSEVK